MATQPTEKHHFRIAVLGPANSGKLSLLERLKKPLEKTIHTPNQKDPMSVSSYQFEVKKTKLSFFILRTDQINRFNGLISQAEAICVLFNASDASSLPKAQAQMADIKMRLPHTPITLVATHTDLAMPSPEISCMKVNSKTDDGIQRFLPDVLNFARYPYLKEKEESAKDVLVLNGSCKKRADTLLRKFPIQAKLQESQNESNNCYEFYRAIRSYLHRSPLLHGTRSKARDCSVAQLATLCEHYQQGYYNKEQFFSRVNQIAKDVTASHKSVGIGFFKTQSGLLRAINQALVHCGEKPYTAKRVLEISPGPSSNPQLSIA